MLDSGCCMLNVLVEVEIDTLVHTLVERQAKMQVKSLKNTLSKRKKAELLDTLVARLSVALVEKPCESLGEVELQALVDTLARKEKPVEVKAV